MGFEVGDKAIIGNMNWDKVVNVVRITPTGQVVVDYQDRRYRNGTEMGSSGYDRVKIREWTQEGEERIHRSERKSKLYVHIRNADFRKLKLSQLERIYTIIEEDK